MKNSERIKQVLVYLITPEDSSELYDITKQVGTSESWSSKPTLFGSMKTILWALLAIILPLALIHLSS